MVQAQGHKGKDGPPDADHFRGNPPTLHAQETSQADKPVATDAAFQDLVERGRDLFLGRVGDHLGVVRLGIEDGTDV